MVAPGVVSVMVTDCVAAKVPPAGLITGVAAAEVMVNVAVATGLLANPLATAIALMVSPAETLMAPAKPSGFVTSLLRALKV